VDEVWQPDTEVWQPDTDLSRWMGSDSLALSAGPELMSLLIATKGGGPEASLLPPSPTFSKSCVLVGSADMDAK